MTGFWLTPRGQAPTINDSNRCLRCMRRVGDLYHSGVSGSVSQLSAPSTRGDCHCRPRVGSARWWRNL